MAGCISQVEEKSPRGARGGGAGSGGEMPYTREAAASCANAANELAFGGAGPPVFGEEFPIINLKNPSEKIEMLIDAIETNKKIEGLELPDGYNI